MRFPRQRGSTQNSVRVFIPDNTASNGAGLTGLTSASTNLTVAWVRQLGALVTYTGANIVSCTPGSWADPGSGKIGFVVVDGTSMPGLYELQFTDAGTAAFGAQDASDNIIINIYEVTTAVLKIGPNMVLIPLVPWNYQDGVRMGLTALPNASPSGSGGLPTTDASNQVKPVPADVRSAVGLATASLDTQLATIDADVLTRSTFAGGAVASVTGNVGGNVVGSVGSVTGLTPTTIAAAIFATAVETSMTFLQYLRGSGAVLLGKISGGATTTNTFRNAVDDTKDRVTATVDSSGDRTAITYDFT